MCVCVCVRERTALARSNNKRTDRLITRKEKTPRKLTAQRSSLSGLLPACLPACLPASSLHRVHEIHTLTNHRVLFLATQAHRNTHTHQDALIDRTNESTKNENKTKTKKQNKKAKTDDVCMCCSCRLRHRKGHRINSLFNRVWQCHHIPTARQDQDSFILTPASPPPPLPSYSLTHAANPRDTRWTQASRVSTHLKK